MTTRELVKALENKGYKVTFRIRKDGGILITSIDGNKFKGASGNKTARVLIGEKLSERRVMQLKKITQTRKRRVIPPTPQTLETYRKKVMRKWRKAGLRGSIAKSNLEAIIKDRGYKGAREYLINMERRAEGYADYRTILHVLLKIQRISESPAINGEERADLMYIYDDIQARKETFKFDWVEPFLQYLYSFENREISSSQLRIHYESIVS